MIGLVGLGHSSADPHVGDRVVAYSSTGGVIVGRVGLRFRDAQDHEPSVTVIGTFTAESVHVSDVMRVLQK